MSCRQTEDLFIASLDAPLDAADQAIVDRHLGQCPSCVGRMRDTIALRQVLGGLGGIETRKEVGPLPETLVQRILAARAAARAAVAASVSAEAISAEAKAQRSRRQA